MSENLTHPTDAAVGAFLDAVEHPVRRRDGWRLHDLLARLGPHRASKACVYVTNLDRVDVDVLEEMHGPGLTSRRGTSHEGPVSA